MDVKEAVATAKAYLAMVFEEESVSELRLEEVKYDRDDHAWLVTLGITRPSLAGRESQIDMLSGQVPLRRTYKLVRVPDDPDDRPSIRIREFIED